MSGRSNVAGWLMLGAVSLGLAACSSPVSKAQHRYELLKSEHADRSEVCEAGRDLVRALSETNNREQYRFQDAITKSECLNAELTGGYQPYDLPDIEPDNMDANGSVENLASPANPFR